MNSEPLLLSSFGEILRVARKRKHMTQKQLAQQLGVHSNTISSWEVGTYLPESRELVLKLVRHLDLNEQEAWQLLEASLTGLSPYWSVPYQRNPFFTGREEILLQLHNVLNHEHNASLSRSYVLSGLGGIGKTQTALEYAYRYANDYSAVFWIEAQTAESIASSFLAIANLLNLPETQEQGQSCVVAAVIRWLNIHDRWLLVLDNVEDIALLKSFLPAARGGSLLFTSRRQAFGGIAHVLDLGPMTLEEGTRFLLRRAGLLDLKEPVACLAPESEVVARKIVSDMAGLPLALDRAGSYIATMRCSLSDYLQSYQSSQQDFFDERDLCSAHPLSVTRTFALTFEQLEQNNLQAAELLTVCAFLSSEAIPESFFFRGVPHLGATFEGLIADPFAFHIAIKSLLAYSLIQYNASTQTVMVHRLVQMVLRGRLSEAARRMWGARVMRAMSHLFPSDTTRSDYWQEGEQLLPHALECIRLNEQWNGDDAIYITLISHVATYLSNRARYAEAEPLFQRALRLGERAFGPEYPLIAEILHAQAMFYLDQGKYKEARLVHERALSIRKQVPG